MQIGDAALDYSAAILITAIGFECEELTTDFIEISRERLDLSDPMGSAIDVYVAVFIESNFENGFLAIDFGADEGIADPPQLRFCLVDETVHAVRSV